MPFGAGGKNALAMIHCNAILSLRVVSNDQQLIPHQSPYYLTTMRYINLFLSFLLLSFIISSCGSDEPNDPGDKLFGVLTGQIELVDEFGRVMTDHSGAVITVEGTDHSATTDAQGYWRLENLPAGTYVISMAKEGFITMKEFGVAFVGGGTDYLALIRLIRKPTFRVESLAVEMVDKEMQHRNVISSSGNDSLIIEAVTVAPRPAIKGVIAPSLSSEFAYLVQVFVGRDATVSKEEGTFVATFEYFISKRSGWESFVPPLQDDFTFWLDDLLEGMFSKGEKVYVIIYPSVRGMGSYGGPYTGTYYDPEQRRLIDNRLSSTPSNVASFVWQ